MVKKPKNYSPSFKFKIISESVKKMDRKDLRVIAEFLNEGLLPSIRVMEKERREFKSLMQTRDKLVKLRSSLKTKEGGSGKTIIATRCKMLEIIYETLMNEWVFKDFNDFVLA